MGSADDRHPWHLQVVRRVLVAQDTGSGGEGSPSLPKHSLRLGCGGHLLFLPHLPPDSGAQCLGQADRASEQPLEHEAWQAGGQCSRYSIFLNWQFY